MKPRNKLVVVAGKIESTGVLSIFEPLSEAFDISVCAIHDDTILSHYRSGLALKLFSDIPDMPGYLRGLDDELEQANIILALETSQLSSFQAMRGSLKFNIPIGIIVNETRPFLYEGYANIRAIQTDIFQHANKFLATTLGAVERLNIEGIKSDRISYVAPAIGDNFRVLPALREKFRKYIGVEASEYLILFQEPLEAQYRPMEALMMLKGLMALNPELMKTIRMIFVGAGTMERELKYRAFDLGLGKQILFLSQNTAPFIVDLYNASDVLVRLRKQASDSIPSFPRSLIEAMACGVVPLIPKGGVDEALAAGAGVSVIDDSFHHLTRELERMLKHRGDFESRKAEAALTAQREYALDQNAAKLRTEIDVIVTHFNLTNTKKSDPVPILAEIDQNIRQGALDEATVMVEDYLLRTASPSFKSELLRRKGDMLVLLRRLDVATEVYSEAIQTDESNYKSYFGLGQVAFLSHANEDAMTFFRKVLSKSSNHSGSLLGIGLVHQRIGLIEESMYWFNKCLSSDSSNQKALSALTQVCLESKNLDIGIAFLEQARELIGDVPSVLVALGQLYLRDGRIEEGKAIMASMLDKPVIPEPIN